MKLIRKIKEKSRGFTGDFEERIFVMLTMLSVFAVFIVFIGDILLGESIAEILVLGMTILITPFVTKQAVRHHRTDLGAMFVVLGSVFVILPVTFFFGGGFYGGSVIWIAFSFLYIGLVLHKKRRIVMLGMLCVMLAAGFLTAWFHPEYITLHSEKVFLIDVSISIVVVGMIIFVMVWFQNRMFVMENRKAKEEAKKVEELNRAQSHFFSSMSHEIRTPINTILGLNEIILRQEDISDEIIADAKSIQGAGNMLLAIINDILDMSKIESGKMDIVPVSYHVGEMMSEIVNMIWSKAAEKGLQLHVNIDPSIPSELYGDEVRIKQILINLLNNAVKYTESGEVRLYMEGERVGKNQVLLTMTVTDTGIGIKKESIPYLFQAFRRMDEEKNRYIEGTGLGLAIVKQIVDLMDGKISVNSVYTQGSTFTVKLCQDIVNAENIGNINIVERSRKRERNLYRQSFEAPDARVLIVDDNELNIVVESKLLLQTKVITDAALNGAGALEKTLDQRYDVIFMDHLMPEMNGIECLQRIRTQSGGLNKTTPVVVLTANAGSENQELYRTAGFDDYLLKPVSGAAMEETLLKYLPGGKVYRTASAKAEGEEISTARAYTRKTPICITASSMCDLPAAVIRKLSIGIIPFSIHTDGGMFWDNVETVSDELVKYMTERGKNARSEPPTVSDFEHFFAEQLTKANHVVHFTLAKNAGREYERALQAAKAFHNVTVIDTECFSGSMGLLVLAACQMAEQKYSVDQIEEEVERAKKRLNSTFIIDSTEFMMRMGNISKNVHMVSKAIMLHPSLQAKKSALRISRVWLGSREKVWRRYIAHTLSGKQKIDTDILLVSYVGLTEEDLVWIEREIRKRVAFETIVFQRGSAAISLNCGPGAFGLFYMKKGEYSYELRTLLPEKQTPEEEAGGEPERRNPERKAWYQEIDGIDSQKGIENCGSEKGYLEALAIFHGSILQKSEELQKLYMEEDREGYTIKVHALKSSAKIIGAAELGELAQKLEDAGKAGDAEVIRENHEKLLSAYRRFEELLKAAGSPNKGIRNNKPEGKPVPDSCLEEIRRAAEDMDIEAVEKALDEMGSFQMSEEEQRLYEEIREKCEEFDYDGITNLMG